MNLPFLFAYFPCGNFNLDDEAKVEVFFFISIAHLFLMFLLFFFYLYTLLCSMLATKTLFVYQKNQDYFYFQQYLFTRFYKEVQSYKRRHKSSINF